MRQDPGEAKATIQMGGHDLVLAARAPEADRAMRRVGNRLRLGLRKWLRQSKQLELFRFRQRWGDKHHEFECVGGPFDGQVKPCHPRGRYCVRGGYYQPDPRDARMHYYALTPESSWRWSDE
jgi:hypothetical protein